MNADFKVNFALICSLFCIAPISRTGLLWADETSVPPSEIIPIPSKASPDYTFDPTFLEHLAVPQEAPEGLLPPVVSKENQWRGSQCGITQTGKTVIRHAYEWNLFWDKALRPYSRHWRNVPAVDFSKEMVVGVFRGEKRYPGYEIRIDSAKMENRKGNGNVLVVRYRNINKLQGVFSPPFAVQPFHLLKVPAYTGDIVFINEKGKL